MTGPEVMRAFERWCPGLVLEGLRPFGSSHLGAYPLWVPQASRWYVRERAPGTRIWRGEEDGSFTLLQYPKTIHIIDPKLREAFERYARDQ